MCEASSCDTVGSIGDSKSKEFSPVGVIGSSGIGKVLKTLSRHICKGQTNNFLGDGQGTRFRLGGGGKLYLDAGNREVGMLFCTAGILIVQRRDTIGGVELVFAEGGSYHRLPYHWG